ncbi:hypothetical protein [Streptomyces sp. NPDC058735]|uniref:hypothetical protein n=1 Tax=unclassified Streptomyces TaxID=2593676 RepID=UPI0036D1904F
MTATTAMSTRHRTENGRTSTTRFKSPGTTATSAALFTTALSGTVATAGTASAAPQDCSRAIVNVKAKETVRSAPKKTATALGIWGKGKRGAVCNDGKACKGGSYTACGKTQRHVVARRRRGERPGPEDLHQPVITSR